MSGIERDERVAGSVTLPAEAGREKEVLELARKWGADAIRDSDGTHLSPEILKQGYPVYSTICLVRADQAWAREHREQLAEKYLMSSPVTAVSDRIEIDLLHGYFKDKYEVDRRHDPRQWWEVIDRTTGRVVDTSDWDFAPESDRVVIHRARRFHVYTVSFLAYLIWDSTSMYNHLINHWTRPHVMSVNPYAPETYRHVLDYFDQWLAAHRDTNVVRLTTLAFHFALDSDENGTDKYRDWLGYTDTVSPDALDAFAAEYGYRLRPEDFVDQGYYNATYRAPSPHYRDWMDFIHRFVVQFGKALTDRIHRAGKQAAIFWGDHWIGVEPYSPCFQDMAIDIHIGACEDGVALRRVADAPGPQLKEIRLYPYFFPDVFRAGGNPTAESARNWARIRRALFRAPVDRIGYGGYPSLTLQFPDFVEHVAGLCDEFREFKARARQTRPYTVPIKVAVLDAWGALRSWINHTTPDQKFHVIRPDTFEIAGSNALECLAGLPVQVAFLSFADIERAGVPADVDILLNEGAAGTAWSGGENWINDKVVTAIREWVYRGGGFIGIIDPSACEFQGQYFQLADVMGVQKEIGHSIQRLARGATPLDRHFILADQPGPIDLGVDRSFVYVSDPHTQVLLAGPNGHILLSAHEFGQGRSVYMAGLPYRPDNSRLVHRAIFWAGRQENELKQWFSSNPHTDCAAFPETGYFVVANASDAVQETVVYDGWSRPTSVTLRPYASQWFEIDFP